MIVEWKGRKYTKFSVNLFFSYQILNIQIGYLRLGTLKVLVAKIAFLFQMFL